MAFSTASLAGGEDRQQQQQQQQRVRRLLAEAGVHPSEVDPSSLEVLQRLYAAGVVPPRDGDDEGHENESGTVALPETDRATERILDRGLLPGTPIPAEVDERKEGGVTGGSAPEDAMLPPRPTFEDLVLRRLEDQTQLILKLDRRVEELSWMVRNQGRGCDEEAPGSRLAHSGGVANPRRPLVPGNRDDSTGHAPPLPREVHPPPVHQPLPAARPGPEAAAGPQQPPLPPPAPVLMGGLTALVQYVVDLPTRVRESRLGRIVRLYDALRRQLVPDVDARFLLKMFVVLAVLAARFSRGGGRRHPPPELTVLWGLNVGVLWEYRFHLAAVLALAAFVVQSGYADFWYLFFVKEDYPTRIWNGEDIDVEAVLLQHRRQMRGGERRVPPVPPRPGPREPPLAGGPPQPAEAAPELPAPRPPAWRGALVGGHIPRPNARQEHDWPAPIRWAVEIGFLLSSFVLSIFPMWQPQAAPDHMEREPEGDDDGEYDYGDQEGDEDHEDERDSDRLPDIRPPQDPAEYEDDEGDEAEDAD